MNISMFSIMSEVSKYPSFASVLHAQYLFTYNVTMRFSKMMMKKRLNKVKRSSEMFYRKEVCSRMVAGIVLFCLI